MWSHPTKNCLKPVCGKEGSGGASLGAAWSTAWELDKGTPGVRYISYYLKIIKIKRIIIAITLPWVLPFLVWCWRMPNVASTWFIQESSSLWGNLIQQGWHQWRQTLTKIMDFKQPHTTHFWYFSQNTQTLSCKLSLFSKITFINV